MSEWPISLCVTRNRQKYKYLRFSFNCDLCTEKGSFLLWRLMRKTQTPIHYNRKTHGYLYTTRIILWAGWMGTGSRRHLQSSRVPEQRVTRYSGRNSSQL